MTTINILFLLGVKTLILSLAAIVAFVVLRLTRCRSPKVHRVTWSAVLLLGIVGAGIPLHLPVVQTADSNIVSVDAHPDAYLDAGSIPDGMRIIDSDVFSTENSPPEEGNLFVSYADTPATEAVDAGTAATTFYATLLCIAWCLGIVVITARRMMLHLILMRALRSAAEADGGFAVEWQHLLAEHNIAAQRLPLLLTDHVGPGLVWRWRSAAVLVPRDLWDEATPEMRDDILRHELAHYRNRDLLRSAISRMIAVVHWFNPVSWFVLRQIDEAIEWLCDLVVFGTNKDGATRFAESLVAVHETAQTISLGRHGFGSGCLQRRISQLKTHLETPGDSNMKKTGIGILLTLIIAAGLFQVRFVPVAAEDQETVARSVSDGVKSDTESKSLGDRMPAFVFPVENFSGFARNEDHSQGLFSKAYFAADLVSAIKDASGNTRFVFDQDELLSLLHDIRTTVAPESWNDETTIWPFYNTGSLIIRQTEAVHTQIAEFLRNQRKVKCPASQDELDRERPMIVLPEKFIPYRAMQTPVKTRLYAGDIAVSEESMNDLINLVKEVITPDEWGKTAHIEAEGDQLVITHNPIDIEQTWILLRKLRALAYRLGPGDTLGIYIQGITGAPGEPIPIHFSGTVYNLPPAMGYPFTIRDDGTLSLPKMLHSLKVEGLTLKETEELIRRAYVDVLKIVESDKTITVSLIRPHTFLDEHLTPTW